MQSTVIVSQVGLEGKGFLCWGWGLDRERREIPRKARKARKGGMKDVRGCGKVWGYRAMPSCISLLVISYPSDRYRLTAGSLLSLTSSQAVSMPCADR